MKSRPKESPPTPPVFPPKPANFQFTFRPWGDGPRNFDCPKRIPRGARHLGGVEWAWGPAHSRGDSYFLSTDRAHSRWILWNRAFDKTEWRPTTHDLPIADCPKRGIPAKKAAVHLLLSAWSTDRVDAFHHVTRAGFLSVEELIALRHIVWPRTNNRKPRPRAIGPGDAAEERLPRLLRSSNPKDPDGSVS